MIYEIFSKQKPKIKKELPKEKIIIDYREKNSSVPSKLVKLGIEGEFKELKTGDYLVKETIIERKTINDFIQSMINKRLYLQIENLKQYQKKLIIIEGNFREIKINMHPNAIKGFILSITLEKKIPVIFTEDAEQTAEYIALIARKQKKHLTLNPVRKNLSKKQQLEFIIQAFPNIGAIKSKKLLQEFKTLKQLINTTEKKLKPILGKKSKEFLNWINKDY
ncbi:MAG: ERCC4 domain-containing protein [Nanoarchaeota archaeon]|nr:ERCC4 domain-containing protein [Nanoarchaeota archaeon]